MTFDDSLFTTNLWDLADYTNGRPTKPSELVKQGIPIIKIAELSRGITTQTNMVSRKVVDSKHIVRAGDLLFAWSGTIGIHTYDGPEAALNQHIFKVVAKDFIDQTYLRYLLQEQLKVLQGFVEEKKTTMGHVTIANLKTVEVSIPKDLNKQRHIASYLESLDNLLNLEEKKGRTLEDIAQTIFKSWFIDFDPVKAKMAGETPAGMDAATAALFPDCMEESELGLIPKGWRARSIGDSVIKQKVGKLFDSKTSFPYGSVPVLDQGKSGVVGFHDEEPGVFASPEAPLVVFANHTCSLRLVSYPFSVIQNVFPLTGNQVDVLWLYFAVEGKQQFDSYKGHWPDFVLHKIIQPTEEATHAFRLTVEPLLKEKWILEHQSKVLGNIRDSLLPRLISGELQIPEEMLAS
jgi:type I restriction enzyme S subunit